MKIGYTDCWSAVFKMAKPAILTNLPENFVRQYYIMCQRWNTQQQWLLQYGLRQTPYQLKTRTSKQPGSTQIRTISLDEAYQAQYATETRTAALSGYFAGLAIIISCLGLFGLAAFIAQKRRKEIGIRKVIGASSLSITTMLSKEFMKLIAIAILIAVPVSWWLLNSWLQSYSYRINISPMVFITTGILMSIITMLAISAQTIKAALSNPVKNLRTE